MFYDVSVYAKYQHACRVPCWLATRIRMAYVSECGNYGQSGGLTTLKKNQVTG